MTLKAHVIQAIVASAIMAFFLNIKENIVFFLSIILIDVDHYFDYVVVCKRFNIRDMFKFHKWVWEQRDSVYGISIFHTVEVFILVFLLGFLTQYFWVILFGFILHMILDLFSLYKNKSLFNRAFSIVEYIVRRKISTKGYPIPSGNFWDLNNI